MLHFKMVISFSARFGLRMSKHIKSTIFTAAAAREGSFTSSIDLKKDLFLCPCGNYEKMTFLCENEAKENYY